MRFQLMDYFTKTALKVQFLISAGVYPIIFFPIAQQQKR